MKKSITLFIFFAVSLLYPIIAVSQFNTGYLKAIAKEKFDDTEKKLLKDIQKKPADVELNFTMAILYISPKYQNYNEEKAYEYLINARKAFESITDEKLKKKLDKIPVNAIILENYNDTICMKGYKKAADINTTDAYENFLNVFTSAPSNLINDATGFRNERKFESVIQINTIEAYQDFINKYPDAKQKTEAIKRRNALAFIKTQRLDKIQDYRDFISKYPDAAQINDAYNRIHELAYQQAERENTAASYKYFIDEYPSSKQYKKAFNMMEKRQFLENTSLGDWKKYREFIKRFPENSWKNVALDSIYMIGIKTESVEILNFCIESFKGDKRSKALHYIYDILTVDGEKTTLDMFYSLYDDETFNDLKMADYQWASIGDSLLRLVPGDLNKPLYDKYIKETAPGEKTYRVLRRLIELDIDAKNWSRALETINIYAPYFKGKNKNLNDLQYFLEILKNKPKAVPKVPETSPATEAVPAEINKEVKQDPANTDASLQSAVKDENK